MKDIIVEPMFRDRVNGETLNGAKFIFPDGQEINVYLNCNAPDMITISGDDRIQIIPWATNMCRIKYA